MYHGVVEVASFGWVSLPGTEGNVQMYGVNTIYICVVVITVSKSRNVEHTIYK